MKKVLFTIAFLYLLVSCAFVQQASANEVFTSKDNNYKYILLPDGSAEIVSFYDLGANKREHLVPANLDGHPVSSIGDNAFSSVIHNLSYYEKSYIKTEVVIPEGIISIGNYAFANCTEMTSITLPSTLKYIGDYAFSNCVELTKIFLPDRLEAIGVGAFDKCTQLDKISLSNQHSNYALIDGVLFEKKTKELIYYPLTLSASSYRIPQGICSIGKNAFQENRSLTSIFIPDSVTIIKDGAFAKCASLTDVTMSANVKSIGERAFEDCISLTAIEIPETVTDIAADAFYGCRSLPSGLDNVQIKMANAEKLFNEGKYREAVYAYRMIPSTETLKKSYELQAEYLWEDNCLSCHAMRIIDPVSERWENTRFRFAFRNKNKKTAIVYIEEKVKNNSSIFSGLDFSYSTESQQMYLDPFGQPDIFVTLEEGKAKILQTYDFGKTWSEKASSYTMNDIVLVDYPYALKTDGTLVSLAKQHVNFVCNNLVDIRNCNQLYGLRCDGRVIRIETDGQMVELEEEWSNVVELDSDGSLLIGYRANGSVVVKPTWPENSETREIPEMHGLHNIAFFSDGDTDTGTDEYGYFWGLTDDGTLISTYPKSPELENIADYSIDVSYFSNDVGTRSRKTGTGGATLFCMFKDGSFARYSIEGLPETVKHLLPTMVSDEAVDAINEIIQSTR